MTIFYVSWLGGMPVSAEIEYNILHGTNGWEPEHIDWAKSGIAPPSYASAAVKATYLAAIGGNVVETVSAQMASVPVFAWLGSQESPEMPYAGFVEGYFYENGRYHRTVLQMIPTGATADPVELAPSLPPMPAPELIPLAPFSPQPVLPPPPSSPPPVNLDG